MAKNKNTLVGTFAAVGIGLVGIAIWYFLIFIVTNDMKLLEINYTKNHEKPLIVRYYIETAESEQGSYTAGYWLYINDAKSGEQLDKKNIKSKGFPEDAFLLLVGNEIWMANYSGFITTYDISSGKIVQSASPSFGEWKIGADKIKDDQLLMINKYNERGWLNIKTKQIVAEESQPVEIRKNPSMFFFVKKYHTSTRLTLYYYQTSKIFPEPQPYAGSIQPGQTIDGWRLSDWIKMENGSVFKEDMDGYADKFDTSEHIIIVNSEALMPNPYIVYQDSSAAVVITCEPDENPVAHLFRNNGKEAWSLPCPVTKEKTASYNMMADYSNNQTIISCSKWIWAVNNQTGKQNWLYIVTDKP